jgi:hypothetical protein
MSRPGIKNRADPKMCIVLAISLILHLLQSCKWFGGERREERARGRGRERRGEGRGGEGREGEGRREEEREEERREGTGDRRERERERERERDCVLSNFCLRHLDLGVAEEPMLRYKVLLKLVRYFKPMVL